MEPAQVACRYQRSVAAAWKDPPSACTARRANGGLPALPHRRSYFVKNFCRRPFRHVLAPSFVKSRRARWLEATALKTLTLWAGRVRILAKRASVPRGARCQRYSWVRVGGTSQLNFVTAHSMRATFWQCHSRHDSNFYILFCAYHYGFGVMLQNRAVRSIDADRARSVVLDARYDPQLRPASLHWMGRDPGAAHGS